jgi:MazG family protein
MREEAIAELRDLIAVVERLRAPGGCPWDHEQTHESLRPYLLEEAYELFEAIDSGAPAQLREELGDVLLQVLMHSEISAQSGEGFDIGDVAATTRAKMVHRHPHVFGDTSVRDAAEVVVNWERLKKVEKGERLSLLDGVPRTLPALAYALGVQKRPARVGFDETPTLSGAVHAVETSAATARQAIAGAPESAPRGGDWTVTEGEVRRAVATGEHAPPPPPAPAEVEAAVGDLLFATVALARRLRVNPEEALRRRATQFADRFRALERQARAEGVDLHDIDEGDWQRRWAATAP